MKIIKLIAVLLFFHGSAYSECGNGSIWAYPQGKFISTKPVIILEGYGSMLIERTEGENSIKLYLKCKRKKIELLIKSKLKGHFSLELLYLTPAKPLELGETYELCIENTEDQIFNTLKKLNPETKKMAMKSWTVNKVSDTIKPQWNSMPLENSKYYSQMGCGPSSHVNFSFDVNDPSEVFVRAKLTQIKNGAVQEYFVEPEKQNGTNERILSVGYGMCSGEFELLEGDNYKIEFDLIDFDGNETPWSGLPICFVAPPIVFKKIEHLQSVNWQSSIPIDSIVKGDTVVFFSQPYDSISKNSIRFDKSERMLKTIVMIDIEEKPGKKVGGLWEQEVVYHETFEWFPFGEWFSGDGLTINVYKKNSCKLRLINYEEDKMTFVAIKN